MVLHLITCSCMGALSFVLLYVADDLVIINTPPPNNTCQKKVYKINDDHPVHMSHLVGTRRK